MKANCDEMRQNYTERKKTRQIAAQLLHASRNVHQLLDNNVDDHRVGERVQVGLPSHGAESHRRRRRRRRRTFGTNCENPPKITFEKFVKLSGHTCVCNNLTSFECEVHKNRKRK